MSISSDLLPIIIVRPVARSHALDTDGREPLAPVEDAPEQAEPIIELPIEADEDLFPAGTGDAAA